MKKILFVFITVMIAGGLFMFFGLLNIDKSEPEIVKLNSPIKMVGVAIQTSDKTIASDAVKIGKIYKQIKNSNIVKNKNEPWAFAAVSRNFSNNGSNWEYVIGDVVDSFSSQPENLIKFEIPSGTYAVFPIKPKFGFLWGLTIGLTKKYIYTEWLPKSNYSLDSGIVGDFEFHDERSLSKKPMIELYVSLKKK
jgi:predicted transcriptional regulator YdeE